MADYKRLGDYIIAVDERNSDLSITLSQGINNNKYFQQPRQVAENSKNDKIVRRGYFAYNRATTRNGDKISIAYREGEDCTVSAAYQVFYIKDEELLNPHYLLLWFKRPTFDRYARFKSHGSAHEFFEWDEMCNVMLPVPPIEEQRRIVEQYQTVERRIKNNERLIALLEDTAQTIFRHRFVENIDPNNLPEGWRMGHIDDFATIYSGKSLTDKVDTLDMEYKYPVAGASGIIGYSKSYNFSTRFITTGRVGTIGVVNKYLTESWAADNVLVFESDFFDFTYQVLKSLNYDEITKGGVQSLITQGEIKKCEIIIPAKSDLLQFEQKVPCISDYIQTINIENELAKGLLSLLLENL